MAFGSGRFENLAPGMIFSVQTLHSNHYHLHFSNLFQISGNKDKNYLPRYNYAEGQQCWAHLLRSAKEGIRKGLLGSMRTSPAASLVRHQQMYLSRFQNVFVQISKCNCPICQMYLYKLRKELLGSMRTSPAALGRYRERGNCVFSFQSLLLACEQLCARQRLAEARRSSLLFIFSKMISEAEAPVKTQTRRKWKEALTVSTLCKVQTRVVMPNCTNCVEIKPAILHKL